MATVGNRLMSVQGPYKHEVLNLSAVTDADTVTSQMQRPLFAIFITTTDTVADTVAVNVGVSSRTLTINSSDLSGGADTGVMLIWGF